MSSSPVLEKRSDLIELICMTVGDGFTRDQAIAALSRAVKTWGCKSKSCFCIDLCPLVCGVCEYDLFCCGVDDVVPYVQPRTCGCGTVGCWHRLACYEVRCGKLYTDGTVDGQLRLEYFVEPPPILSHDIELVKTYQDGDETLWIKGAIDDLPPAGFLYICDHWVQYQCWAQVRWDGPEGFDVTSQSAWIDPVAGIDADIGIEQPGIDPAEGIDVPDIECGVHTVLSNLSAHCASVASQDFYAPGTTVEFGISANKRCDIDLLVNMALMNSYQMRMSSCQSSADRAIAFDMMQLYREYAAEGEAKSYSGRRVKVNRKGFMDSGNRRRFDHGRGRAGSRSGHLDQRLPVCC